MTDTIFDKIIRKEIPADIVFEDENVLAFRDINPQAPVHVLVIPKKKIQKFSEFAGEDVQAVGHYFQAISKIANLLDLDEAGYRVVFNNGENGGQEVDYVHAHVLGERKMRWPPG